MVITDILFRYLTVSLITSIFILTLCIVSPFINKIYAAKAKYYIWLMIAVYLVIPIEIPLLEKPIEVSFSDTVMTYTNVVKEENHVWQSNQGDGMDSLVSEENLQDKAITMSEIIILIWAAGFLISVSSELCKYYLYQKNIRRWSKRPKEAHTLRIAAAVSKEMRIQYTVPILVSEKAESPMLLGFIHPCIYLPHENFEEQDLFFVIRHELAHYERRDVWYKVLLFIARAIHWFNPFVYIMCRYASADIERSCDDFVLMGKPYKYRKAYSETILAVIKHQKWNLLSTDFYGGMSVLKERFQNILDMKNKKSGRMICLSGCICIIGANSLVGCEMVEKMTDNKKQADVPKEILNQMEELPEELSDEEWIASYVQGFIDEFNGTIAGQNDIELAGYIKNQNLLSFAQKMIELTQKQEQKEINAVIYGGENEFDDITCEEISQNLYYINAKFCCEGSGMSCQLLIKKQNEELEIADFYFGTPDGIDTIATGHYTEREVSNPQIWEDEDWVLGVYEKMLEYEGELQQK